MMLSIFSCAFSFSKLPASSSTKIVSGLGSLPISGVASGPMSIGLNFFLTEGMVKPSPFSLRSRWRSIPCSIFSSVNEPTFLTGFEKRLYALPRVVPVMSMMMRMSITIRRISAPALPARRSKPPPTRAPRTPPLFAVTCILISHT